jgi:hypothetical protein
MLTLNDAVLKHLAIIVLLNFCLMNTDAAFEPEKLGFVFVSKNDILL